MVHWLCLGAGLLAADSTAERVICSYKVIGDRSVEELKLGDSTPWIGTRPQSRFVKPKDVVWRLTEMEDLAKQGKQDWIAYNQSQRRVVASLKSRDHELFRLFLEKKLDFPKQVQLGLRLVRVQAREIGMRSWDETEVAKRRPEELLHQVLNLQSRKTAKSLLKNESGEIEIEALPVIHHEVVDLRFTLRAEIEGLKIDRSVGADLWLNEKSYLELGSVDDNVTHLLEIEMKLVFADLSPCSAWQEWERASRNRTKKPDPQDWQEGFWLQSRELLRHVAGRENKKVNDLPKVKLPRQSRYLRQVAEVIDLGPFLEGQGFEVREAGWILYEPNSSVLLARLSAEQMELLDYLLEFTPRSPDVSRMNVLLSLVTFRGDLKSIQVPPGARKLGQIGMGGLPGQKWSGSLGDGEHEINLTIQPNFGGNRLVDMRFDFRFEGERAVRFTHLTTVRNGRPKLVPLSKVNGVVTALVIEASGGSLTKEGMSK